MLEKSCISLGGRHRPLGMPDAQRRHNKRTVAVARKSDQHVTSNEEGFLKTNFPSASSVALPLLAVTLVCQQAAAITR